MVGCRVGSRDYGVEMGREQKTRRESREQKAETREQRAESRDQREQKVLPEPSGGGGIPHKQQNPRRVECVRDHEPRPHGNESCLTGRSLDAGEG
jgi:hypothetical protein